MIIWEDYDYLYEEYIEKGRSTRSIAIENDVYPNTIRRALIKNGIPVRNKSAAQKNFLKRNTHPMSGKERTKEEKRKISEGIQEHFDSLTPEELAGRKLAQASRAVDKWESMSEEEKKDNISKMHRANRRNSGFGSKNENLVAKLLREAGYKIVQRSTDFSPRNRWEIDIAIPKESVAIEWDGAAHFEPIYGEESLRKVMEKDSKKENDLVGFGWTVIRCRDHSTAHSLAFCRRAANQIIDVIKVGEKGTVHYLDIE